MSLLNNSVLLLGEDKSTSITSEQYSYINWGDPKKTTKELCCAVFGRKTLATHSLTGKTSDAFRSKEAKPPLDSGKTADDICEDKSTSITSEQYSYINWGDPKKTTKELCCAVFGRKTLATHSLTGKTSDAFRSKEAKPPLDSGKTADDIYFINAKTGMGGEKKNQSHLKCSDEEKYQKGN
ncbi:UNVERIFIED_CONTAM: hypothetical protein FKN15_045367 [Acipenser sinensis]